MRRFLLVILIISSFVLGFLTTPQATPAQTVPTLMPLGDSITVGSYRSYLQTLLGTPKPYDFVGSQTGGAPDPNHEGHGGYNTYNILNGVPGAFPGIRDIVRDSRYRPDIVLLMLGTNDSAFPHADAAAESAMNSSLDNLRAIIDIIKNNTSATIYLSEIIPMNRWFNHPEDATNNAYFNAGIATIASEKGAVLVRQSSTGAASPLTTADLISDGVHPSEPGARKIAENFYAAMTGVLPPGTTPGVIPPGISRDPAALGFTPLKYPCDVTVPNDADTNTEFHPLRPYPGSPCDPYIPQSVPEAETTGDKLYQSFACGKSLNAKGTFEFPLDITDVSALPTFPSDPSTIKDSSTLYKCSATTTSEVCAIRRVGFNVSVDLSSVQLPIIGNTQNFLDDASRANNYLEWYLTGVVKEPGQPGAADYKCMGEPLAEYMNAVVEAAETLPRIKVLSPAFNIGAPSFTDIWTSMTAAGARWDDLYGIAANAYNIKDVNTITGFVADAQAITGNRKYYLTEIGMIEILPEFGGVPRSAAMNNLQREIADIKAHRYNIQAGLLFNSFNTKPDFQYNVMNDTELTTVCGAGKCNQGIGINSAGHYLQGNSFYDRAEGLDMTYALSIANADPTNPLLPNVMPDIFAALDSNLTPIIRIGYGDPNNNTSGGFDKVEDYVSFIQNVNSKVQAAYPTDSSKFVIVIGGPNEPNAETWATPACVTGGNLNAPNAANGSLYNIDRMLTYSGPLKKLLPQSTQHTVRDLLNNTNPPINTDIHNYFVDPINSRRLASVNAWEEIFKDIPFSSLEDTTTEFTLGVIPGQQPGNTSNYDAGLQDVLTGEHNYRGQVYPNSTGRNSIRLTIVGDGATSDSRLYAPHLRSSNYLSYLFTRMSQPKDLNSRTNSLSSPEQKIDAHQQPFGFDYLTNENTRNTEIVGNDAFGGQPFPEAPAPLFSEFDQRCDLKEVRINPGDNMLGRSVQAHLMYTQSFRYTIPPTPTPDPSGAACRKDKETCTGGGPGTNNCCNQTQDCQPQVNLPCEEPSTSCDAIDRCANGKCPHPWEGTSRCVGGTRPVVDLPTEARVAIFTKTPLVERIYELLVAAPDSFLRHLAPAQECFEKDGVTRRPCDTEDKKHYIRQGDETFPAAGPAGYSAGGQASGYLPGNLDLGDNVAPSGHPDIPANTRATAGDETGGPQVYFARLGSLFDYFLGSGVAERFNVQKFYRPKGFTSGGVIGGSGGNTGGNTNGSCTVADPKSTNLESAVQAAIPIVASKYSIPASWLQSIFEIESQPYLTEAVSYVCSENSFHAAGPMQITRSAYGLVTCESERYANDVPVCTSDAGKLSRCDIEDNVELAARVLLWKAGLWVYGPGNCRATGGVASNNKSVLYTASNYYYGSCTPDSFTQNYSYRMTSNTLRTNPPGMNYGDIVLNKMGLSPTYITPQCP